MLSGTWTRQRLDSVSAPTAVLLSGPSATLSALLEGVCGVLQRLTQGPGSTTAQRFQVHISPIIVTTFCLCHWGHEHKRHLLMLELSSGLMSIMSSNGIYGCLAVPKSTIAS